MSGYRFASVHGGHSGQFCGHAEDALDAVVARYAELGFEWVCLTEHMPSRGEAFMPDEERAAGHDPESLVARFDDYFANARRLQEAYAERMPIFVGFETEAHTGYREEVAALVERYRPDFLLGSVHHVHDVPFDWSPEAYARAVTAAGGIEALYVDYFDLQLELIEALRPEVVGHFDLVRIHDPDYTERWEDPRVMRAALRNLEVIADLGLILDFNCRALLKGQPEPYVSAPFLAEARRLGIDVVPGDDSHGVSTVGACLEIGIDVLQRAGFDQDWVKPTR